MTSLSSKKKTKRGLGVAQNRPNYKPCAAAPDGKHRWERLTHNAFEKCQFCGEPRFAMVQQ